MNIKQKQKIIDKWIVDNGAAEFNLKNRDILLHDGGLFYIENITKIKEWTKCIFRKGEKRMINGKEETFRQLDFVPRKYNGKVDPNIIFNFIKKKIEKGETFEEEVLHFFNKEKYDYLTAILWFEDLDNTINYLIRMKKMLLSLGYKTNFSKK